MRARLYTADGNLGFVELVDGAAVADVVRAIREHRLFITPVEPAAAAAATTLPGDTTLEDCHSRFAAEPVPKRRRSP